MADAFSFVFHGLSGNYDFRFELSGNFTVCDVLWLSQTCDGGTDPPFFQVPSEKWSLNLVHLSYMVFPSLRNWPASTTVLFFRHLQVITNPAPVENFTAFSCDRLTSVPTVLPFWTLSFVCSRFGYILPAYPTLILRRQEQKQRDKK